MKATPTGASPEVWWHEARAEALGASRALGRLLLLTLVVGVFAGVWVVLLWLR